MFIIFIIFLVILLASLFVIFNTNRKADNLRRQLILSKLKESKNTSESNDLTKKIVIKFKNTSYTKGTIIKNCYLHISPLDNSYKINTLPENTQVSIVDSAEIDSLIWYEISILNNNLERTNSKGWIKEDFISLISDSEPENIL